MDVRFECTRCGQCCRNLKLPLTVAEAGAWLSDGNPVQVICEALPWGVEPDPNDRRAQHRRGRSFAALSGSLPTRVIVILVADLVGNCPNLRTDLGCGIYGRRPLVCRIYPAEINPFIELDPAHKGCPPEAWSADRPLLQRSGRVIDQIVNSDILRSREEDARDVPIKARLCAALGLDRAALADEGFVVYSPDPKLLLVELTRATDSSRIAIEATSWQFVSNRAATVAAICASGADCSLFGEHSATSYRYLGYHSER